ncbi:hypothetical protein L5515_012617 [Caenorhabditis briggsae]|uniref:Transmembrane protein n=1 Tax=Caenorhabditis briggsae TaxID=6238 RepID=A0AAE9JJC7_CAEBR|nr:hypothetical protein L5515_012617 [Caenorhabditis briggsae]
MSSSAKIYSVKSAASGMDKNVAAYRATPLSTRQIFAATVTLSIFSFLYLVFAQKHALLFYIMTGLIGVYILFVYASGIGAVLYMVAREYPEDEFDCKSSSSSSREMEESKF